MHYQRDKCRHLTLDQHETNLRWLRAALPLSEHPTVKNPRPEPKPLAYYQGAPNGLFEIFQDCSEAFPIQRNMIANQALDGSVQVSVAWLRAEAEGVAVTTLADLVPKYLEQVPRDPADGRPLRALIKERKLNSVGQDLVDDGGVSNLDLTEPEDIGRTFDLTFTVPRPRNGD